MKNPILTLGFFVSLLIKTIFSRDLNGCSSPQSHDQGYDLNGHKEDNAHVSWPNTRDNYNSMDREREQKKEEEERVRPLQIAGSRLPDCSHACGSCSPCRLRIISSLCASLAHSSETCPVTYRCICNNKYYPVP
ncbi:hypothetical protein Tsubulata_005684 [Turnera subulata]|uniref:Epidermal patterning factor-like protein n=1 Tax=Turnera subulata TaxID=218843 RepID=A0A9Q0FBG6_9ROSI|nr:hypothetical protein Tsubulata_005684 [Turnera subulata]